MRKLTAKKAAALLPETARDANKYTRGVCELVVGSERYPGAAVLAARAANRAGAGYVRVYTCREAASALRIVSPSCVAASKGEFLQDRHVSLEGRPLAVVLGCGTECRVDGDILDPAVCEANFLLDALAATCAPAVVDGGGLAALACERAVEVLAERADRGFETVITPHAGEAARLAAFAGLDTDGSAATSSPGLSEDSAATSAPDSPEDPDEARLCLALARSYASVCVLKGPTTYIAAPDMLPEEVFAMREGTPALAKAGTGDVLAGVAGSLLAQGCTALDAACIATVAHALAGRSAARKLGERCVCTEDVLDRLPRAFRAMADVRD